MISAIYHLQSNTDNNDLDRDKDVNLNYSHQITLVIEIG